MVNKYYIENYRIFFEEDKAIDFLVSVGKFQNRPCTMPNCENPILCIRKKENAIGGFRFFCNWCKKSHNIVRYINGELPRIKVSVLLHFSFCYAFGLTNFQSVGFLGISEPTYIKLKRVFNRKAELLTIVRNRVGGIETVIQIDETACCRRRAIYNPTSLEPIIRDTKWIIGLYCESTKKIKLAVLVDRTIGSISEFIRNNVNPGTLIKTDGYPSYPRAVADNNCEHVIINHSRNFVDEEGNHTNSIESVWSSLKIEIRKRRGVMYHKLEEFIREYQFIKENTTGSDINNMIAFFKGLVDII